jgi:T5SS/PEP-CTERM-associated repeat protein
MIDRRLVIAAVTFLALSPTTVAHATKYWKNSVVTGNWSNGNNWSAASAAGADNGGVPVGGEAVNIAHTDGTARTVTYDVNAPALGVLGIDLTGAGTAANTLSIPNNNNLTVAVLDVGGYNGAAFTNGRGAVNQAAGTTTVSAGGDLILGVGSGSTGTYTLSGGTLAVNQSEFVALNGTGTFNHSAGSNTLNANAFGSFFVGYNAGSTGTYNLSGTGELLSYESEYIGYSGDGYFNQTGGAHGVIGSLYLGYNSGSAGIYTMSGGTLNILNDVVVGSSGTGSLWVNSSATAYVTNNLSINGASVVNINGGTLRFNTISGIDRVNYFSGTVQLSGNRNFTTDTTITTLYGAYPTIPSGKGLNIEGDATIGSNSTYQAVFVNGGSLAVSGDLELYYTDLAITGGGNVSCFEGRISSTVNSLASASVSGAGSTWNVGDDLILGGGTYGGSLAISDGALVNIATALTVYSNGTVHLYGGTLRMGAYARYTGGVFNFYAGTIQRPGDRIIGGDSAIIDLFGAAPTISSGKGLTVEGTATLLTAVTIDGGTFSVGGLASAEELQLVRGTLNVTNQAVTIGSGGILGSSLDVNEDMTVNVTLGITNQGLVTGDGQIGGTFTNAASGQLRAEAGRSLKLTGVNNTNAGQINLFGGQLEFTQNLTNSAGAFISGNGSLIVGSGLVNQGTMNFAGTANIDGAVTNAPGGKIISGGGGATIFYDDVVNNGEIRTSTNGFTVFFGAVSGGGTFTGTGTVNFEGDLSPGSSPAAVNFAGDVGFGVDATLQIELSGTVPGMQHDKLNVTGELALDGALEVSLINGFIPSAGQTFNILDWGSLAGTFSSISLPTLTGLSWNTSQLYTTGVISVATAPGLPGDYNDDGKVDAADYVVWRKNEGTMTPLPNDPHGGTIGAQQFNTWRANFGNMAGSGSFADADVAVPEPAAAFSMLFGILATLAVDRRRIRQRLILCLNPM